MDLHNEENRRILERSIRFLLIAAMHDIAPNARLRFEHSMGNGIYVTVEGSAFSALKVRRLEQRMWELVAEDLPILEENWSREKVLSYFEETGRSDTVRLLAQQTFDEMSVCGLEDVWEYFYGDVVSRTGELSDFSLKLCYPGLLLNFNFPDEFKVKGSDVERPKLMRTYMEASDTIKRLRCANAADVNDLFLQGYGREFIRVTEALQTRKIAGIAEEIADLRTRVVFIAGPSSSGKTTFANRLGVELRVSGCNPIPISLDNYYRDPDGIPRRPDGRRDLECLEAIDVELFNEQLRSLLRGDTVELPIYSFKTKYREPHGITTRMGPGDVLVVEGIHGLNPKISEGIPDNLKYKVYVSALTPLNLDDHNRIRATDVRLLRRLVRDARTRGADVNETMEMWDDVRTGEVKYIYPYQEQANVIFNTSLHYEIPFLKAKASSLLREISPESPYASRAHRILNFLDYFVTWTDESEIPPTSILREFIGGCTFYDEPRGVNSID